MKTRSTKREGSSGTGHVQEYILPRECPCSGWTSVGILCLSDFYFTNTGCP